MAVIDVRDGSVDPHQSVVIREGRIAMVGPADEIPVPGGAEVVNGTDRYLIPGLWDMHTHLLWSTDASEHVWTDMPEGADRWTLWDRYYAPMLNLLIANGVTGIREMWGNPEVVRRVRREAAAGARMAPRMVVAGHVIDGPPALWPGLVMAATPSEARAAVDSLFAAGAEFIKVRDRLRPDVYHAVLEQAQELGLPVVGHVPWLSPASRASGAGQRSMEHLTGVVEGCSSAHAELLGLNRRILDALEADDEAAVDTLEDHFFVRLLSTQDEERCRGLLRWLAGNRTWQVPTLVLKRSLPAHASGTSAGSDTLLEYVHPAWRASWAPQNSPYGQNTGKGNAQRSRLLERKAEITGMAAQEGVPILSGTDTPNAFVFPGFALHDELELLVEAGLTPFQALQSGTLEPARFLNATDSLGIVEEGKLADLVLLDANPLEDIRHTRRIRAVVVKGQLLSRERLDSLVEAVAQGFATQRSGEPESGSVPSEELAIVRVDVVDVARGDLLPDRTVLIRDGRISAVAPAEDLPVPEGAQVIEGSGKYLMPGLADMHVHFGRGGGLPNSPESVERALRQYLYYGVTSVLNLGAYHGRADQIVDLRQRREAGDLLSPHIYATGGLLTVPGSHPVDHWSVPEGADADTYDWSERGVWVVRTRADVRDVVGRVAEAGMDGLKVVVESDRAGDPIPQMPPVLLETAVEEAARRGLPVFAHATSISELEAVVAAGVDAVVHLVRCCWPGEELGPQHGPDPALLERMRSQGTYYVPTLSVRLWTEALWGAPEDYLTDPFLSGVEPQLIDTLLASPPEPAEEVAWAWRRAVLETLKEAHDAGVRLVAGSDPPGEYTFHGYSIHDELKWMVEAGLSPEEALLAATRRAAEMIGAAEEFGTVEPGRRADLLLLSDNPLEDIRNTRTIEHVILDGRVIIRERLLP